MALKDDFESAATRVQSLAERPTNEELLELYAFYKQGTTGDASGARPGIFDIKGRKKFDTWVSKKGMTAEAAMTAYIELVNELASE